MTNFKRGELLSKAILLATTSHHGQFDRGGNPYILHPLAVLGILSSKDEELQCIAVLHDVVEDCKVSWKQLEDDGYTDRIISALRLLTKLPGQTLEEYKVGIFTNEDAMQVKRADLIHNSDIKRLKGVSEKDIARMGEYHRFFLEIGIRLGDK